MSDRPNPRRNLVPNVAILVLFLAASLAGSGFALVGPKAVTPSAGADPAALAEAARLAVPPTSASITGALTESIVAHQFPGYASMAASAPAWFWDEASGILAAGLAGNTSGEHKLLAKEQADAHLVAFQFTSTIIFGAVALAGICAVAGAVSFGVACLAVIGAVGVILLVNFLLGSSAASLAGQAANNLASYMLTDAWRAIDAQVSSLLTEITLFNGNQNTFSYEAAAAALSQLPNGTFNGPLALVQSSVLFQAASFLEADMSILAGIYTSVLNDFDYQEGSQNSLGAYCPVALGNDITKTAPGPANRCPTTSPASFTYPLGVIQFGYSYTPGTLNGTHAPVSCPEVWLYGNSTFSPSGYKADGGSTMLYQPGAAHSNLTLVPITPGTKWVNLTTNAQTATIYSGNATASDVSGNNLTHVFQSGGYYLCMWNGAAGVLTPTMSFPLNALAYTQANATGAGTDPATFLLDSEGSGGGLTNEFATHTITVLAPGTATWDFGLYPSSGGAFLVVSGDGQGGPAAGPLSGFTGNLVQAKALFLVNRVMANAQTSAAAYWTFLRLLGYTNVNQVPPNCIIPTPNAATPPNIPPSVLATVNLSRLLSLYYGYLWGLANDFNATAGGVNATSFCGKHVVLSAGSLTFPFATFAYGWLYVPGATHNSTGKGNQVFTKPGTWNISGVLYLSPSSFPMPISLNKTWEFSEHNPVTVFSVPFTDSLPSKTSKSGTGNFTVNPKGPWNCMNGTKTPNCNQTAFFISQTGLLLGNSTSNNGSAYPSLVDAAAAHGYAVYLTVCYQATGSALNPVYVPVRSGVCSFTLNTVGGVGAEWGCSSQVNVNCTTTGSGGILIGATACGVAQFAIWAQVLNLWTAFTGTSALGCLIAEALTFVTFVAVLGIVLWVGITILDRRGARRP